MSAPRKAYDRPHGYPRVLGCGEPSRSQRASHTQHNFHLAAKIWSPGDYRDGTALGHSSVKQRVPRILRAFQLRFVLRVALSCVHYPPFRRRDSSKSTDHLVLLPTKWSKAFLATSRSCFGRATLRPLLRPRSQSFAAARNALSAPSSATSKALANGLLTGKPSSSLKFFAVKACGTYA